MKVLKLCFAGLVIFLSLVSCNLRPGRNGPATSLPTLTPTVTVTASITPIPSPTRRATFALFPSPTRGPSITPFPSMTPIPKEVLEAIQAEVTKARFLTGLGPYQCKIVSTEPQELEVFRPREEFPGIFRLQNVGKKPWTTDNFAYFYISGSKFQTQKYKESFIPYVVNVDEQLNLRIPMRAPAEPGIYFTIWGLRIKSDQRFFCTFAISIIVERRQ